MVTTNDRFDIINAMIQEADSIGIAGHVNPDHDSFASCIALYTVLKNAYPKKYIIVYVDIDKMSRYNYVGLSELDSVAYDSNFIDLNNISINMSHNYDTLTVCDTDPYVDTFIGVDAGSKSRIDDRLWDVIGNAHNVAYFDHHKYTAFNKKVSVACDPGSPSATSFLYRFFNHCGYDIPTEAYNAMYIGLAGDTGNFMYSNTTTSTLELARHFSNHMTAVPYEISQTLFNSKTLGELEATSYIIQNMVLTENDQIATFQYDELDERNRLFNTSVKPVHIMTSLDTCKIAVSFVKNEDEDYRVSLRSSCGVDVDLIARDYGGGGHYHAAGCTIKQKQTSEVLDKLIAVLGK